MKYIKKPKAWWDLYEGDKPLTPGLSVEPTPAHPTGLVDAHGDPIYLVPDNAGFVRHESDE